MKYGQDVSNVLFVKTIFQIHREEEDTRKHNTMKMEADTNVPSAKTNIYLWIQ